MNYRHYSFLDFDEYAALQDTNDLSVQLDRAHKSIRAKQDFKKYLEDMEESIYQRVLKAVLESVDITVKDEATPAIRDLKKELSNLGK